MAFIECRDLHFSYSEESGEVLHGVDLDIEKGSFVALLGHNGCGKSTMAKLFNGMLVPTSGTVTVDGIDTAVEETQLEKQRVAIAGVIAMETMCIVLDEPTAMLDPRGRQEVMDTIRYLNREKGITVILITHYMDEAVQADRVVVMDGGNILTDGDPRTVFAQVELLKRHKLDVPQATELIYRLNAAGCRISGTPLDEDECVKAIAEYLKLG